MRDPRETPTDPTPYTFREWTIPVRMMAPLLRYVEHGIQPGHFLMAVLCNDLIGAVGRADDENLRNLPAYVGYLYHEMPSVCWGSPEIVRAWTARQLTPRTNTEGE